MIDIMVIAIKEGSAYGEPAPGAMDRCEGSLLGSVDWRAVAQLGEKQHGGGVALTLVQKYFA